MAIRVERVSPPESKGQCFGGHMWSDDVGVACSFPAATVAMYDETGIGLTMSRDEAEALASALMAAAADA